ncbi:hypothetical protein BDW59DRAFT_176909 [Aspergillus cavernicola]|uniref:DUF1446-domain-containing protein n=1 Tax=Aspergillus cavernicola TaxID=176166 RepID=A0ABR4HBE3_9EURO
MPLRIGNVSGATGDHPQAMHRMAYHGNVNIIVGDWLSEMNIAWNAISKSQDPEVGFEQGFLDQLDTCLDRILEQGIKVITNAGALNTPALAAKVESLCRDRGYEGVTVAQVLGDDISDLVREKPGNVTGLQHLDHEEWVLGEWEFEPHCGVAYIGAWRIVEALKAGADIVVCGRVTDADSWDELAGALVAGRLNLIECGAYVTGANFSGFKSLPDLVDLAFPIAELSRDGTCVITKCEKYAGAMTRENTIAQLLYELQGELYLNPDVVADLSNISIQQLDRDRVRVQGITGLPPPPTTKAMIAAPAGYQAEATFYINGLDIARKAQTMRNQLEHTFTGHTFSKLSQQAGTVRPRVFAQARRKEDISADKFKIPIYALRMQSYPDGRVIQAPSPSQTREYPVQRPSYETRSPISLSHFGPTQCAPLGSIVHARSGDKADNSNIGFFVRHKDEYPWLQSFLTVPRLKELFADDWPKDSEPAVERCEFPEICAVHFRVLDFLGIASSSRIDGLGKGVGEYLRSAVVDIPVKFLERGWI